MIGVKHQGTGAGKLLLWLRYVDDTFAPIDKDEINDFHEHLNIYKTLTFSLPKGSRIMVRFLFLTDWSPATATYYRRRFTGDQPTLTDSLTSHRSVSFELAAAYVQLKERDKGGKRANL